MNMCLFVIFLVHEKRGPSVRSLVFVENIITKQNFLLMQAEVYNRVLFPNREFKDLPRLWTKSVVPRTETLVKDITRTRLVLENLTAEISQPRHGSTGKKRRYLISERSYS